ncbi:MAG: TonB-dependent receptor plug domain-containing protein [Thermoanaerobaculum sp.]
MAGSAQYRENVTVVGSYLPLQPLRPVVVWTREDLARLPAKSVSDLLRLVAGAGLARRGPFGVQADAALAGAPFEGVLVLVNGVPVNDPQTGHFHLDLPVPLEAVEQVEVLLGPASALFGANAVGGVISIRTRVPERAGEAGAGRHSLTQVRLAVPVTPALGLFGERMESSGFRPDSDFHASQGGLVWRSTSGGWDLGGSVAFGQKQFGAWTFYSSRFPHQRERTSVALATFSGNSQLAPGLNLSVRAGARQHRDTYLLDKHRPDWYRNRHRTRQGYGALVLQGNSTWGDWAIGFDGERQLIASSRLGYHARNRLGIFGEAARRWGILAAHAQLRQDFHSDARSFTPALALTLAPSPRWELGLGASSSFRLPSFTELYYTSPASVGNPGLAPERARTYEATARWTGNSASVLVTLFQRRAKDLVDWVGTETGVYQAQNHARATTWGAVLDARFPSPFLVRMSAAYLHSRIAVDPGRSAYALTHPTWELASVAALPLGSLEFGPALTYRKPQGRAGFALADLALRWPQSGPWQLELSVANLADRRYQEVPGVPQPGRWWLASFRWRP